MITAKEPPQQQPAGMPAALRILGVAWGIGGIGIVLVYAAVSLGRHTVAAVAGGLGPLEWLALIANVLFMAWAEGYRGFQLRFSPRVAARALHLYEQPTRLRVLLAPLFCAGYFAATARLIRTLWVGTLLIVLAVLLFNLIPQPWRGILDAGVLVGLSWGVLSLLASTVITFRGQQAPVAAEVPA